MSLQYQKSLSKTEELLQLLDYDSDVEVTDEEIPQLVESDSEDEDDDAPVAEDEDEDARAGPRNMRSAADILNNLRHHSDSDDSDDEGAFEHGEESTLMLSAASSEDQEKKRLHNRLRRLSISCKRENLTNRSEKKASGSEHRWEIYQHRNERSNRTIRRCVFNSKTVT